jgi:hypothetical protein
MSSVITTTDMSQSIIASSSDTSVAEKEMKKRAPRRSKEEIAAEKEAKAKRQEEKASKKRAADEKKAAATAKKEARQAKMDAKIKMVDTEGNEIKKNLSAYFLFQAAKREDVKSDLQRSFEDVKVSLGDVAKKIGELWKACSDEDKSEFVVAAAEDKLRYESAVAANPANAEAVAAAKATKTEAKKKTKSLKMEKIGVVVDSGSSDEELEEGEIREDNVDTKETIQAQFAAAQADAKNAQVAFARACEDVVRLEGILLLMKD